MQQKHSLRLVGAILLLLVFVVSVYFAVQLSISDITGHGIISTSRFGCTYVFPSQMTTEKFVALSDILGEDMPYDRIDKMDSNKVTFLGAQVWTLSCVQNPQDYGLIYEGSYAHYAGGQVAIFAVAGFLISLGVGLPMVFLSWCVINKVRGGRCGKESDATETKS